MSTEDLTKQALADAITDGAIGCRSCGDTWERPVSPNGIVGPCEDCGDSEYAIAAPPSTSAAIRVAAEEICRYFDDTPLAMGDSVNHKGVAAILSRYFGKGETDATFVEAFRNAAIKCHVGFKHRGPWDTCEWVECEDRRKMIESHRAAAIADNDKCEHGISLDHDCLHCENQRDEINIG